MKNMVKKVNARQSATLRAICAQCAKEGKDKRTTILELEKQLIKWGMMEHLGEPTHNELLAVCLSFYSLEKEKVEGKTPFQSLLTYLKWKEMEGRHLNDLGAFGDCVEVCCRVLARCAEWRVQWADLSVKRQGATDITIKGKRFEIGTNGKTFSDSIEENWMEGPFDSIAYGCFDEIDKKEFFALVDEGNIYKVLRMIASYVHVWENKQDFMTFMEKCGKRSSALKWNNTIGRMQVVYNPSIHGAFMVKADEVKTLEEYLHETGKNDII